MNKLISFIGIGLVVSLSFYLMIVLFRILCKMRRRKMIGGILMVVVFKIAYSLPNPYSAIFFAVAIVPLLIFMFTGKADEMKDMNVKTEQ